MSDEWINIRLWFRKGGRAKYISHLDLNRCMTRAIQMAKIPLWYTEGFHPHAFLTFALPLSLGIEGTAESMDIRLIEEMDGEEIVRRINPCLPEGIELYDCTSPLMKPGKIAFAEYEILLEAEEKTVEELQSSFEALLGCEEIIVKKKTKSGIKDIDIRPFLDIKSTEIIKDKLKIRIVLPAGSTQNINPYLMINALQDNYDMQVFAKIIRLNLFDANMELFR